MAYSQTLELVAGDSLPVLTVTLRDSNIAAVGATLDENVPATWAPINVTGGTVRMYIREIGATTLAATLTATILNGAAGSIAFSFSTGTFPAAGLYEGEIEATFSGGGIQTVGDLIKFKVRAGF